MNTCKKNSRKICLSEANQGTHLLVKGITSCIAKRRHLCALGFTNGEEVELKEKNCSGSCVVIVRGATLSLSPDCAKAIMCETVA